MKVFDQKDTSPPQEKKKEVSILKTASPPQEEMKMKVSNLRAASPPQEMKKMKEVSDVKAASPTQEKKMEVAILKAASSPQEKKMEVAIMKAASSPQEKKKTEVSILKAALPPQEEKKMEVPKLKAASPPQEEKMEVPKLKAASPPQEEKMEVPKLKAASPPQEEKMEVPKLKAASPPQEEKMEVPKLKAASPRQERKMKAISDLKDTSPPQKKLKELRPLFSLKIAPPTSFPVERIDFEKKCRVCVKTFSTNSNRRKHELRFHGKSFPTEKNKPGIPYTEAVDGGLVCPHCDKVFSTTSNRNGHVRTLHNDSGRKKSKKAQYDIGKGQTVVQCNECGVSFGKLNSYREHLLHTHGLPTAKEQHHFNSYEDFSTWKDSLEMNVGVNYCARFASYDTREGRKNILYCRRSGIFRPKVDDSNRKRAGKSQGSSKLGFYCTSSMEVIETDGKVLVTFYPDHRDHDLDFTSQVHMNIPKSEKDKIAGMITQGINHKEILERVREASAGSRTSLIKKKDIRNICAEYGLLGSEYQPNDYVEKIINSVTQILLPSMKDIKNIEVLKTLDTQIAKVVNTAKAAIEYPENNELPMDLSTSNEPVNKNCIKQNQLYTTKKRTREEDGDTLKKPCTKTKLGNENS